MSVAFFRAWHQTIIFSYKIKKIKKGNGVCFAFLGYGRFLSEIIARTAPITIMTTMIATIPYMRVL